MRKAEERPQALCGAGAAGNYPSILPRVPSLSLSREEDLTPQQTPPKEPGQSEVRLAGRVGWGAVHSAEPVSLPRGKWGWLPSRLPDHAHWRVPSHPGEPGQAQGHCTVPRGPRPAAPAATAYTPRTISARRGKSWEVRRWEGRPPGGYRQTLCLPAHPSRGSRHAQDAVLQALKAAALRRPAHACNTPPSSQPVGRLSTSRRCSQEGIPASSRPPATSRTTGLKQEALPSSDPKGGHCWVWPLVAH